ncbi:MAG: ParA family protein, partial [Mogibacterium sp.]|nr:ParA family protein [Mogibacterium sp.]
INSVRRIQPRVRVAGALITMWHNSPACIQGECALRASGVPIFEQTIRRSEKVTESIFMRQSLQAYSPQSAAGRDYRAFVEEFLAMEVR